ncbi:flagellar basal body P-ring protein FlgI, partial [Ferrovibrio terrae]
MIRFANTVIRRLLLAACALALALSLPLQAQAGSRIKDIADFEGIRDNMLVGYGLVVGLDGTGDSLTNAPFTRQSLQAMLERFGVNIRDAGTFRTQNLAAVMVTAVLPPFARHGGRIDVTVSTMGDAKSLQGGTLLVTPLLGADGEVYSVAQGAVAISGFKAQGAAAQVTRGTPTS